MMHRAIVACILLLLPTAAQSQSATFSSKVEAVRVDVLVTDKGQPVVGLGPGDFEVFDNGVAQRVDLVSFEEIPLNVVLVLDMSDSVAGDRLSRLRAAAGVLFPAFRQDDQAALVTFTHVVGLPAKLSNDLDSLRAAFDDAQGMDETALVDGTFAGLMVGESDVGRSVLIVLSDGLDTLSWLSAETVLDVAKRSDVVAYAVAVRSDRRPDFLRDLTAATGGRLLEVERTENLGAILLRVLEEFRHRYLVSYTPSGVQAGGWHRLEVRVKRNATVKARPGYLAGL